MEGCDDGKMEESPEESSWTFYIEGFMRDNNNNNNNINDEDDNKSSFSNSESDQTPSLLSDAASSAVLLKKTLSTNTTNCCNWTEGILGFSGAKNNTTMCKQNSLVKKHRVTPAMDFDLEDTASSPVNSPKVSYMNPFMNQKEKGKMDDSEVKRNNSGKGGVLAFERDTDLKKRTCG